MPRPATLDHLRSNKKGTTKRVTIMLDSEVADRYNEAKTELDIARMRLENRPDSQDLQDRFDQAEQRFNAAKEDAEEYAVEFLFRSRGRRAFEDLLNEHPPTKDHKEKAKALGERNLNWNIDTFPIALVAMCWELPDGERPTESDVKELWESEDWNAGELMTLFQAALEVNQTHRVVDLGKD